MNELIGKYLNGYKIVKVEKDPFIKGQINLWTDEIRTETFGDRTVTKFFIRDEGNSNKIYQELVDKEKYELQQRIDEAIKIIESYNLGKYDYSIPPGGITELLETLKGCDK